MTAHCLLTDHSAPHAECECGLYAVPEIDYLILDNDPDVIIGIVQCWGVCHITPQYWKAERARVSYLFTNTYRMKNMVSVAQ